MSPEKQEKIVVVAGIPPGDSGTGRMMRQLISKSAQMGVPIQFIHKERPKQALRPLAKAKQWKKLIEIGRPYILGQLLFYIRVTLLYMFGSGKLLIMHPQTLGFKLTSRLISKWKSGKVYFYVLDSSYFCVRSYNYVPDEGTPCTRCLGGDFAQRDQQQCKPFPVKDDNAFEYTQKLLEMGRQNKVKFLAQNHNQKKMLLKHFGDQTSVEVVGLWGEDWTEPFEKWQRGDLTHTPTNDLIVYHGFYVPAKGSTWFIELARANPDQKFFAPFPKPVAVTNAPPNIEFKNLTWESGLWEMCEKAKMVMVPSLWSAPIEGALIKSLATATTVGIQDNETAFQNELTDTMVLRFPNDIEKATTMLKEAMKSPQPIDTKEKDQWLNDFHDFNHLFIERMLGFIQEN